MRNTRKLYITFRNLSRFRFISQFYILSRKDAEYAENAETICPFSQAFALSLFFAILYFIAKGRGKHMSIFAIFRSFAFFRNPLFYRERTRKTRNTRKSYVHFRNLSLFFAILYFIAKGRGIRGIREKHISLFAAFRSFAFFRNPIFYRERTRKMRNTRKHIYFSNHFRLFALFRNRIYSRRLLLRTRTGSMNNSLKLTSSPSL